RRRIGAVRRPRRRAHGAPAYRSDGVIPLELSVVEPLGRLHARPWADVVTGLQVDSRRIEEGDLFVAVGGGVDFVEHALARGGAAALVPDDASAALAGIAGEVRGRSSAKVVAITGSTGKTSTKDILFALCAPHRRTIANEGNYNNEIGVPLTLCRLEPETEVLIAEMGMRGLGQIAWLASFTRPDIGGVTDVGPADLELVETVQDAEAGEARGSRAGGRSGPPPCRGGAPPPGGRGARGASRTSDAPTSPSSRWTDRRRSRSAPSTAPATSSRTHAWRRPSHG